MCDRIFMIFRGRKVLDGTLDEIQDAVRRSTRCACAPPRARPRSPACRTSKRSTTSASCRRCASPGDPQAFLAAPRRAHGGLPLRGHAAVAAGHLRRIAKPAEDRERSPCDKILIVAHSEFSTLVRSKAFIVGVLLMPVMMGLSSVLHARDAATSPTTRTAPLRSSTTPACSARRSPAVAKLFDPGTQLGDTRPAAPRAALHAVRGRYRRTAARRPARSSCRTASASGELFAFVEIPAERDRSGSGRAIQLLLGPPVLHARCRLAPRRRQRRHPQRAVPAGVDRSRARRAPDASRRRSTSLGLFERDADGAHQASRARWTRRARRRAGRHAWY